MQLTLVISSMAAGGAERVLSLMANYWAAKGWKITLFTFDDGTTPPFYELNTEIHHISLGILGHSTKLTDAISNNFKRIQTLRAGIKDSKPDAVISFVDITNVLTLLATQGLNVPVIVSERSDPAKNYLGIFWNLLRHWTYPGASKIVVQTQSALNYFPQSFKPNINIIPNPVILEANNEYSLNNFLVKPSIIAIGRFGKEKGFDLLLNAFSMLKDSYPEWNLTILGEGALRPDLESLRDSLGLIGRVDLPGTVKNPYDLLKQADLFVLSSRFEGFPNALCEAMACGLPVISTNFSGSQEIVLHEVDGILVPTEDVAQLAVAMDSLMSDPEKRQRLAARAPQVLERFSLEKVMIMWDTILDQAVEQSQ
ncbi:glycosyl transferase group 1 [Crinalium epipsammum PCC 9333]|uniref:Glycosyl transferase group 1 n=1 Tax=Crinalium epipsammum PCC 9333 TaxID=1173022 RepID=K9W271_9CYAN|nr:glycosyltransferase family 4 protein [Crinalium epipsammum]AFZ14316.1 glycosyl transferase group 1 [Crinalium epipsammum PCC 9333]